MAKTTDEARLEVHGLIADVLISLAVDDETTDEDIEAMEDDIADVADMILDVLGLSVVSVDNEDGTDLTVKLSLSLTDVEEDPEESAG